MNKFAGNVITYFSAFGVACLVLVHPYLTPKNVTVLLVGFGGLVSSSTLAPIAPPYSKF